MKLRYVGPDMIDILDGHVYECLGVELDGKWYRVIDESGDDYLYPVSEPAPLDGSQPPGKWEIIEE